jgi:hypothetical protein
MAVKSRLPAPGGASAIGLITQGLDRGDNFRGEALRVQRTELRDIGMNRRQIRAGFGRPNDIPQKGSIADLGRRQLLARSPGQKPRLHRFMTDNPAGGDVGVSPRIRAFFGGNIYLVKQGRFGLSHAARIAHFTESTKLRRHGLENRF